MKLLIELDKEYVKAIDKIRFLVGGRTDRKLQLEIIKAIKNGKALDQEPILDKLRTEIEFEVDHRTNMLCAEDVLEIIDKYREEK